MDNKKSADLKSADFLYLREFEIFKFQPIAHIRTEREQRDGNFGDNACGIVLDKGIIAPNINDGTKHGVILLYRIKLVA